MKFTVGHWIKAYIPKDCSIFQFINPLWYSLYPILLYYFTVTMYILTTFKTIGFSRISIICPKRYRPRPYIYLGIPLIVLFNISIYTYLFKVRQGKHPIAKNVPLVQLVIFSSKIHRFQHLIVELDGSLLIVT